MSPASRLPARPMMAMIPKKVTHLRMVITSRSIMRSTRARSSSAENEEGDSVYLRTNTPHNIYNHTNKKAVAMFCATPPVL